jgi:hypothetical protein
MHDGVRGRWWEPRAGTYQAEPFDPGVAVEPFDHHSEHSAQQWSESRGTYALARGPEHAGLPPVNGYSAMPAAFTPGERVLTGFGDRISVGGPTVAVVG